MQALVTNWGPTAVIVGGYLLGIYFQSRSIAHLDKRIDDMGKRIEDVNNNLGKRIEEVNNNLGKRIDDLRDTMNRRFDSMEKLFTEKLLRVEGVLDARLKHLEEREQ